MSHFLEISLKCIEKHVDSYPNNDFSRLLMTIFFIEVIVTDITLYEKRDYSLQIVFSMNIKQNLNYKKLLLKQK